MIKRKQLTNAPSVICLCPWQFCSWKYQNLQRNYFTKTFSSTLLCVNIQKQKKNGKKKEDLFHTKCFFMPRIRKHFLYIIRHQCSVFVGKTLPRRYFYQQNAVSLSPTTYFWPRLSSVRCCFQRAGSRMNTLFIHS